MMVGALYIELWRRNRFTGEVRDGMTQYLYLEESTRVAPKTAVAQKRYRSDWGKPGLF